MPKTRYSKAITVVVFAGCLACILAGALINPTTGARPNAPTMAAPPFRYSAPDIPPTPPPIPPPESLALSHEAILAWTQLAGSRLFATGPTGVGGVTPDEVLAVERLLAEPNAAEIFAALLDLESPVPRLYALCGLYFTDTARFLVGVDELSQSQQMVNRQRGCMRYSEAVAGIVRSSKAIRLRDRTQSIHEWFAENPTVTGVYYDIAGGCLPSELREWTRRSQNPRPNFLPLSRRSRPLPVPDSLAPHFFLIFALDPPPLGRAFHPAPCGWPDGWVVWAAWKGRRGGKKAHLFL